jgi:hypothetical protein
MTINEAGWDRVAKIVVGVALLALTITGPHTLWGLVGLVPLLTGLLGTCPLYSLAGVSTCTQRGC